MARNVYTVSQVNSYIKNMFTQDYMLNRIYVKGEVSNCKYHTSGHIYFTLKDEGGAIACVMFAGQRRGLAFHMEEGQQVIVLGSVSVYERDGRYQVYAREIMLDGAGELYQRFEMLKAKLEEMGMFAPEYKQPIPRFCKKVGIVTASTGAAVRDIMNISARRNPYVQLILYPALVQGADAPPSIVQGIEALDAYGVDVIIVGRGGGSIEDLWAFNEEPVARAIFHCRTPIISAVGHETDFTIADFVADLRAPTPSAAAELAVYEYAQVSQQLEAMRYSLEQGMRRRLETGREKLERLMLRLRHASPEHQLRQRQQYVVDLEEKLRAGMGQRLMKERHRLELYISRLEGCSPLSKLRQGYAFVEDGDGQAMVSVEQAQVGSRLWTHVSDGVIESEIVEVKRQERIQEGEQ